MPIDSVASETKTLKVGEMAPDFTLPVAPGTWTAAKFTLSDLRGKKNVVLAFYPLAWTPNWTVQMPAYEADLAKFEGYDAQVVGISVDSIYTNANWAKSIGGLTYPLLSDFFPHGGVATQYGVFRQNGVTERALVVIDKEGKIVYIDVHNIDKVPDNEDLFEELRKLWFSSYQLAASSQAVKTIFERYWFNCWLSAANWYFFIWEEKQMEMSRKSVPYTPLWKPLSQMKFAIVTTAGVHLKTQEPFLLEGDESYRLIPGDAQTADLMVTHPSYDHTDADKDINCVFPLDRLRELAASGLIGGISNKHLGYMGFSNKLKKVYEETVPAMARELERSSADAVILTAGWPHVCHRTVVAIQRGFEMSGLPTVLITVSPNESKPMRPPRAIFPNGFKVGHVLGGPDQSNLQRVVLQTAIQYLEKLVMPGEISSVDFPEYVTLNGGPYYVE